MKRAVFCILLCVCLLFMCGCNKNKTDPGLKGTVLLPEGTVTEVRIRKSHSTTEYIYSGKDAQVVVDYIKNLTLLDCPEEESPKNNFYFGYSWRIFFEYADGSTVEISQCEITGATFIIRGKTCYKINPAEGDRLRSLVEA